jgi:hypothetical protein
MTRPGHALKGGKTLAAACGGIKKRKKPEPEMFPEMAVYGVEDYFKFPDQPGVRRGIKIRDKALEILRGDQVVFFNIVMMKVYIPQEGNVNIGGKGEKPGEGFVFNVV